MTRQYLRSASLIVADAEEALDLTQMHFRFSYRQWVMQTPNILSVRVYNLSDNTVAKIEKEFKRVVLRAGYAGNEGVLFDGTIKQTKRGKENPTDTYFDILAADADKPYNQSVSSVTLAAGASPMDELAAMQKALEPFGVTLGPVPALPETRLPRGRTLYGMTRDFLDEFCRHHGLTFTFTNNVMNLVPINGYLPGPAVVLTSRTGMIGIPEQTEDGIMVRCLINPQITPGKLLHIDNASINQTTIHEVGFPNINSIPIISPTNADGFYKVIAVDAEGDTRGQAWYQMITCIAIDATMPMGLAAKGY